MIEKTQIEKRNRESATDNYKMSETGVLLWALWSVGQSVCLT